MNLLIKVEKAYSSFALSIDMNFSGKSLGIFGMSGSGKSTLVRLLCGLERPDAGEILLDGRCLYSKERKINVAPEKRRIAMVFQQHALFPHLDVKKNLLYGHRWLDRELRTIDFHSLVEVLGLSHLLERGVGNLSGGEKQRIALGRAVLCNPQLLIMDEPLSALDDGLKFHIIPYLKKVASEFGIPYLFISHSMVEMRLMTEQTLVLSKGQVVDMTTCEALARTRMGLSPVGYVNLLHLGNAERERGLYRYRFGNSTLLIAAGLFLDQAHYELSSKDIILFKKHPQAISARNLLQCKVTSLFESAGRIGVELACGTNTLVAEVVSQAAEELELKVGCEVFAAMKASAFRQIW
ncbi:molybdenum ABC transporter ATP-binding protein [Citrifermentans bremense]|uniref:molybdenum ABC transporter ATP-binding protein n=1 Tax=Citrifermentans bremense TaxID=60035 RepID=UPI00041FDDC7|nr:molybdenum ABC transporter ATP-binding protein [Citrifermentans bremense]